MMGRDALGAQCCMHIGMFLARSCVPLGTYHTHEARYQHNGADSAGDGPLSVVCIARAHQCDTCFSCQKTVFCLRPFSFSTGCSICVIWGEDNGQWRGGSQCSRLCSWVSDEDCHR